VLWINNEPSRVVLHKFLSLSVTEALTCGLGPLISVMDGTTIGHRCDAPTNMSFASKICYKHQEGQYSLFVWLAYVWFKIYGCFFQDAMVKTI